MVRPAPARREPIHAGGLILRRDTGGAMARSSHPADMAASRRAWTTRAMIARALLSAALACRAAAALAQTRF